MEQERINANVNSLSQKLLEGCKLLSESCPETNVPLVSTQDGRMFSVGNGSYYIRENGELIKTPGDAPPPAPAPALPPATPGSPYRGGSFLASSVGAPTGIVEVPTPVAPTDGQSLSSRVAAKLLEGFTLLSESCPVTSVPLVQDTQGRILSVGTGRWYERTGGELVEAPGAPSPAAALVPPSGAGRPSMAAPYARSTPAAPPTPSYGGFMPTTPASQSFSHMPPPPAQYNPSPLRQSLGAGASAAVHSAVLQAAGTPALPPRALNGSASLKASSAEAVAVLTGRLAEATEALAGAPLREAGAYVVMVKDIALAIDALKKL